MCTWVSVGYLNWLHRWHPWAAGKHLPHFCSPPEPLSPLWLQTHSWDLGFPVPRSDGWQWCSRCVDCSHLSLLLGWHPVKTHTATIRNQCLRVDSKYSLWKGNGHAIKDESEDQDCTPNASFCPYGLCSHICFHSAPNTAWVTCFHASWQSCCSKGHFFSFISITLIPGGKIL